MRSPIVPQRCRRSVRLLGAISGPSLSCGGKDEAVKSPLRGLQGAPSPWRSGHVLEAFIS